MRDERSDVPAPGDLIWIRRRPWRVKSAHTGAGLTRVVVDGRVDGRGDGSPPAESRSFLLPCDRWSPDISHHTRPVSSSRALAWLAACAARAARARTPGSIVSSDTSLFAYQLEPALAVLAGKRRVLIADDVGLGKTIQAALIIAETLHRVADARVLVMAPASLLLQWRDELAARFTVAAQIADTDSFTRLRSGRRYLNNPWLSPGVWLVSPDYLKQPHVIEGIPRLPFDLLVIDEAHAMAGNSQRHFAGDTMARTARHVVMLTATPHDGDVTRFKRLLTLGASGSEADALTIFRRVRIGHTRHHRRLEVYAGEGLSRVLAAIDAFERARRSGVPSDGLALICGVFRKRALSSLAALAASLHRRLALVDAAPADEAGETWNQPSLSFGDAASPAPDDGDVMSADEWSALRGVTGLPQARERTWLERLIGLTTRTSAHAAGPDRKLARVATLLRRSREPVVVFTEYRDSLLAMERVLAGSRRVTVLHGGLSGSEQRRALTEFLDGAADALLATDVASQGLNLQHRARWVVHFDLPWTPMRLEQRVGRVDRIGQSRLVHVTTIGVRHKAEEALRMRVAAREEVRDNAPLPNCTRWTRAAEGLARWFARQRALAALWRGPDPMAVPRARVTASTLGRLGFEMSPVTLVEIPLVSAAGDVVERWFGGASGDASDNPPRTLVRRARALSARARRRLARLEAAQADSVTFSPAQPGLFDTRGLTGSPTGPIGTSPPDPTVHIGRPRPLVILYSSQQKKEPRE